MASAEPTPRYRTVYSSCHSRFCIPCQADRARRIAVNLRAQAPEGRWRLITLTMQSVSRPLKDQLRELLASFRRLRSSRAWRDHVAGGMAVLEVTWSAARKQWHPHLHIVAQGEYWPAGEVSAAWSRASRGSFIVDIRSCHDVEGAARYLLKYLGKGAGPEVWRDDHRLAEYVQALDHVKTLITFGTWRKLNLLARPDDDTIWEPVCSAATLLAWARDGLADAQVIAAKLWGKRFAAWLADRPPPDE